MTKYATSIEILKLFLGVALFVVLFFLTLYQLRIAEGVETIANIYDDYEVEIIYK